MCAVRYLSVLMLAVEVSSAVLDIKSTEVSRCYQCVGSNRTRCEGLGPSVLCPRDRPLCATTAKAPGFESSLTCSAGAAAACVFSGQQLTCTCRGHLCNRPYSPHITDTLKNLRAENATDFLNSSVFANASELYSVQIENFTLPRAEALKHEVTLSPDDEDDGEGSGFEEKVPSAPAAPSSFLPSEHNHANIIGLKSVILVILVSIVLKYS